ncbi:hypothetical protein MYX84_04440 [Acidobacteria bacterium AH-259-O06]|nr:hypothetical protein [Acidobacteria bacterium AH-259-O06]
MRAIGSMEIAFKIAATIVVAVLIYFEVLFLVTVWRSHVDPKATIGRIVQRLAPDRDFIATRDPNLIYQNGEVVGEVTGRVTIDGNRVEFTELTNTAQLDRDKPFEYQRRKLRIVQIRSSSGMKLGMQGPRENVLGDVVCEVIP